MPSTPSDREYAALLDIRQNVERAISLASEPPGASVDEDWPKLYAAIRCLEIISEATRRLTPDLRDRRTDQPWRVIMDSGNVYRHGYEKIQPDEIWRTIKDSLPFLAAVIDEEIKRIEAP